MTGVLEVDQVLQLSGGVDAVGAVAGDEAGGAGTFTGNVNVNKSLTLLGNNNSKDGFDGTRNAESIVHGQVTLSAPNTTFSGFKVEGVASGAGCHEARRDDRRRHAPQTR